MAPRSNEKALCCGTPAADLRRTAAPSDSQNAPTKLAAVGSAGDAELSSLPLPRGDPEPAPTEQKIDIAPTSFAAPLEVGPPVPGGKGETISPTTGLHFRQPISYAALRFRLVSAPSSFSIANAAACLPTNI